jgi:hypothetical protein
MSELFLTFSLFRALLFILKSSKQQLEKLSATFPPDVSEHRVEFPRQLPPTTSAKPDPASA